MMSFVQGHITTFAQDRIAARPTGFTLFPKWWGMFCYNASTLGNALAMPVYFMSNFEHWGTQNTG